MSILVPDDLWEAIGAVATAIATIVALWAAVVVPKKERAEDRSEATHEVLRATAEAVKLFDQALKLSTSDQSALGRMAAQARHQSFALDRLLNRTSLSDGAIVTGAGPLQLLEAIARQLETSRPSSQIGFARFVASELSPYEVIVPDVHDRAQRVAKYAVKRKWPGWKRRFNDFANHGLAASGQE
ncbi:hypothetical protein EHS39_23830 [Ensifer sp. MPMI2T]|nr:hypothetical protein EHS39_23830 [Ensifer sp. MPMI2T]